MTATIDTQVRDWDGGLSELADESVMRLYSKGQIMQQERAVLLHSCPKCGYIYQADCIGIANYLLTRVSIRGHELLIFPGQRVDVGDRLVVTVTLDHRGGCK